MTDPRHARIALTVAAIALFAVSSAPQSASAYWSVASAAPSSGASAAARVNQAATPTAIVATQNDITVSWAASTLSSGAAVGGYTVARYSSTNVSVPATGGCTGTISGLTCTEANVPDGLWTYAITARVGTNWTGQESAKSTAVRSDATAPTTFIALTPVSGNSVKNGNTVYYRGVAAGSFTLTNTMTDAGSGVASSSTAALGGTITGWTHTPSTVTTPAGGPFVSNSFAWSAGTTSAPTEVVTGRDVAGNLQPTTLTISNDITGPTGGAISYAGGATSASAVVVSTASVSDTQSGTGGGYRYLQQSTATLSGTTCGSFGAFVDRVTNPAPSESVGVTAGTCYQLRYRFSDSVGNQTITTSASIVKARSYQAIVTGTPGILNYWRLGDGTAAIDDIAAASNDGSYVNAPALGAAGAIAGDTNTAVTFDGVSDYGQVARQIAGSFSIEFWFKSTQGLGTGNQWWNGAGIVDADVAGGTNDFGVSLLANGQVIGGVGNPDTSVASAGGKNDGLWHHVVFTRALPGGQFILYVDGVATAPGSGTTNSLTASPNINFGRMANGNNYYSGALDEVALYTSVLTPAQVSNHYQSGLP